MSARGRDVTPDHVYLVNGLWNCMVAAGADTSHWEDPSHWATMYDPESLAAQAVEAVAQLRRDYDQALGSTEDRTL